MHNLYSVGSVNKKIINIYINDAEKKFTAG